MGLAKTCPFFAPLAVLAPPKPGELNINFYPAFDHRSSVLARPGAKDKSLAAAPLPNIDGTGNPRSGLIACSTVCPACPVRLGQPGQRAFAAFHSLNVCTPSSFYVQRIRLLKNAGAGIRALPDNVGAMALIRSSYPTHHGPPFVRSVVLPSPTPRDATPLVAVFSGKSHDLVRLNLLILAYKFRKSEN